LPDSGKRQFNSQINNGIFVPSPVGIGVCTLFSTIKTIGFKSAKLPLLLERVVVRRYKNPTMMY
jgi:hypothetical protein